MRYTQSLHWTKELMKPYKKIISDITFISSNLKHDVPYAEFCNKLLHSSLPRQNIKTTHIFCRTSHRKSNSDGLGVIKSYVYCDVRGGETVVRNAKELYDYCLEDLSINDTDNSKPMLNRVFFYILSEEIKTHKVIK